MSDYASMTDEDFDRLVAERHARRTDPREARPVTPDERKQFEASCKADPEWDWDLTIIDRTGDYRNDYTYAGWRMWQASRASQSARIAALEAALRIARDYVATEIEAKREAYGHQLQYKQKAIADDLAIVDAALAGEAT